MSVSKREFFNFAYWKKKRYSTVIFQSGKNPADFEVVENQDIANYELQQAINGIMKCGFVRDGFQIFAMSAPAADKVRIKRGLGWIQDATGNENEFAGIRIELPDVLTNFPALTYDHALSGGTDYYEYTIVNTPPAFPNYDYDLLYVEFYRLEYTASGTVPVLVPPKAGDPEIQDAVLGETALREKWYYEFKYMEGTVGNTNPIIPSLPANHYGIRLAVIRTQAAKTITQDDIFDVRPKFSPVSNLNNNLITVGSNGGNYNNIYDVIDSQTGVNPVRDIGIATAGTSDTQIVDSNKSWVINQWVNYKVSIPSGIGIVTANDDTTLTVAISGATSGNSYTIGAFDTNPYTILMLPGVHTVLPYRLNTTVPISPGLDFGTMGYIRIVGCGIDKTILEFDEAYGLVPTIWLKIGASPFIEFADMTIRIKSTNIHNADLINIDGGTVKFTNCKLGEVVTASATSVGGIVINNGTITITNCEINHRSTTTKQAILMSGTSKVRIYNSIIRQSGYRTIDNQVTTNGYLKVYNSEIIGNAYTLYINGISEFHNCLISKEEWYTGDTTAAGNSVYIVSPTKFYSCKFTGPSGKNFLELEEEIELHDCSHDDTIKVDNLATHTMKFYNCTLTNVTNVSSAASFSTLEFYGCDFLTSAATTIILNKIVTAKFVNCVFKRDGACIDFTDTDFDVKGCHFATTGAVNIIDLKGTCVPNIQNCQFHLGNAGAIAIYMSVATATPFITHCTFIGSSAAVALDAAVPATTIDAGDLDGDVVALKGANVTITDRRLA